MRNRITNLWDLIQDTAVRDRVAQQERAKATACWDMLPESTVELRILAHPHPTIPGVMLGHLVLFVGDLPALTVASGSKRVD